MDGFRDWLAGLTARELIVYGLVGSVLLGGGALWYVRSGGAAGGGGEPVVAVEGPLAGPTPQASTVFVHVAGLVRRPGVYELTEGARVAEAIQLAGGPKGKADLTVLNLAAQLVDGQQIVIPKQGPDGGIPVVGGGGAPGTVGGLVNVNTADAATLDTLPGIGEVMAQRIIDHREQNGPFASVDDLINVKGIGPITLEELRPLVTI